MHKENKISICIIAYNHEKFVDKCLNSIINQSYQNYEIVIFDDGSSDNTLKEVEKFSSKFKDKLSIYTQKNTGNIPKNANTAISKAIYDYVYLISMDDFLKDNKSLEKLLKELEKDNNIQFCAADQAIEVDDNSNPTGKIIKAGIYNKSHQDFDPSKLIDMDLNFQWTFFLQSCLFRRDLLIDCGGYDEDMIADDLVLRIKIFHHMKKNPNMSYRIINDSIFCYRIHGANIHKNIIRQMNSWYEVLSRYGDQSSLRSKSLNNRISYELQNLKKKMTEIINHDANAEFCEESILSSISYFSNLHAKQFNHKSKESIRALMKFKSKDLFLAWLKKSFKIK